jgi:anaerobic nitric oxide reductase transcription regulator
MVGRGPAMQDLFGMIRRLAPHVRTALITGETGTGKELAARAIHTASRRSEEALIEVNCAALPESIAESELFGHVAGAFTGALKDRGGKFEVADGGTLFLDEVGELPLALQPKLLRALQQGEIQRVGSDRTRRVNVRVIAATNRDLAAEVARGRFRADLYHRLAVYPIRVPPLRERREDVPVLAAHFLDVARRRLGLGRVSISGEARERLAAAEWPGNVRELENVLSRAVLRAAWKRDHSSVVVEVRHLDLEGGAPAPPRDAPDADGPADEARSAPLSVLVDEFKRRTIEAAVRRHGGSWAAAARELGLHRGNLHHTAKRLGLSSRKSEPGTGRRG